VTGHPGAIRGVGSSGGGSHGYALRRRGRFLPVRLTVAIPHVSWVPRRSQGFPGSTRCRVFDVALVGVPFDIGTSYRPGPLRSDRHTAGITDLAELASGPAGEAVRLAAVGRRRRHRLPTRSTSPTQWRHRRPVRELNSGRSTSTSLWAADHTVAFPLLQATHRVHGP